MDDQLKSLLEHCVSSFHYFKHLSSLFLFTSMHPFIILSQSMFQCLFSFQLLTPDHIHVFTLSFHTIHMHFFPVSFLTSIFMHEDTLSFLNLSIQNHIFCHTSISFLCVISFLISISMHEDTLSFLHLSDFL